MATYRFRAYDSRGGIESGQIDAPSLPEALARLETRGLVPFETAVQSAPGDTVTKSGTDRGRTRMASSDLTDLLSELATLVQAELPLDQSLRLLIGQSRSRAGKVLAQRLLDSVLSGDPLSAAIERHVASAPAVAVGLVRAGEARGNLGVALGELVHILRVREEMRRKIRSALAYPLILAITAMVVIGIVVMRLVPSLVPLFTETGVALPPLIGFIDAASRFVGAHAVTLAAGVAGVGLLAFLASRTDAAQLFVDDLRTSIPIIGPIRRKAHAAVLARTIGVLVQNGVPLASALQIAAGLTSGRLSERLFQAAERLKEGEPLSRALEACRLPAPALQFVAVGEEVNRLDQMLVQLAGLFETQVEQDSQRALALLGPAMTVILGVVIGSIIMSVMQAILSVNELALQ